MTDKIARVCDYCDKTEVIQSHSDTTSGILMQGEGNFLLMRDVRQKENCRPSFNLQGKYWCSVDCLIKALERWISKVG